MTVLVRGNSCCSEFNHFFLKYCTSDRCRYYVNVTILLIKDHGYPTHRYNKLKYLEAIIKFLWYGIQPLHFRISGEVAAIYRGDYVI